MRPSIERRTKYRLNVKFPVQVQGVDGEGTPFRIDTSLDNVSANGLFVRLVRDVDVGSRVNCVIALAKGTKLAVDAEVIRVSPLDDGAVGIGLHFENYQFV